MSDLPHDYLVTFQVEGSAPDKPSVRLCGSEGEVAELVETMAYSPMASLKLDNPYSLPVGRVLTLVSVKAV